MVARCGTAGSPTTLLRALLQFTIIAGGPPRSEIVAGAVNSAISNFGSQICATTRISPRLAVTGACVAARSAVCARSETLAPLQRTSRRNGKPATERLAQS